VNKNIIHGTENHDGRGLTVQLSLVAIILIGAGLALVLLGA
jgi:hypothetical protein